MASILPTEIDGPPDFYLEVTETGDPARWHACRLRGRLRDDQRDDYMLVALDPPIIGQGWGLGGTDIDEVLIHTRHRGYTLFPVTEWPAFVGVHRIVDQGIKATGVLTAGSTVPMAHGVLHRSRPDA